MNGTNCKSLNLLEEQFRVEGDGVLETFYPLLWTKDPVFGTSMISKVLSISSRNSSLSVCTRYSNHSVQRTGGLVLHAGWSDPQENKSKVGDEGGLQHLHAQSTTVAL